MALSRYPHFTGDPFKQAYKYIDAILQIAPEYGQFDLGDLISLAELPQLDKDIARYISKELKTVLMKYEKYVEPVHLNWIKLRLTNKGREAKKAGGHLAYKSQLEKNIGASVHIQSYKVGGDMVGSGNQDSLFEESPMTHKVTTTPNIKANKTIWYSSPLFIYLIWPLIVVLIGGYLLHRWGWI